MPTSDEDPDETDDGSSGQSSADDIDHEPYEVGRDPETDSGGSADYDRPTPIPEKRTTIGDTSDDKTLDRVKDRDETQAGPETEDRFDGTRPTPGISDDEDDPIDYPVGAADTAEEPGMLHWFLASDQDLVVFLREFLASVIVVMLLGLVLFAVSGVWPPMVAVESGSMEPHMYRGDLVFVMEEHRLTAAAAVNGTGIASHRSGVDTNYRRFGDYGDVIVYNKNGATGGTPIIHRARFWVNESENWVEKANSSYLGGRSCATLANCPADHDGFITKGDNNGQYDQITGISDVVSPEWVKGTAEVRIPWLGHVRLGLSELFAWPHRWVLT